MHVIQEGRVTTAKDVGTLLIECRGRHERRYRRHVSAASLKDGRLEDGGVAGGEV